MPLQSTSVSLEKLYMLIGVFENTDSVTLSIGGRQGSAHTVFSHPSFVTVEVIFCRWADGLSPRSSTSIYLTLNGSRRNNCFPVFLAAQPVDKKAHSKEITHSFKVI